MATKSSFKHPSLFAAKKRAFKSKGNTCITIKKPTPLKIGSIYDYGCLDEINSGAYGTVYKAQDKSTGEIVALKKVIEGLSSSTMSEINVLRSLKHPSIVEFKKVVAGDHSVFIVMEYLDYDLYNYITKTSVFTLAEVKRLMMELLEGVRFLHRNRVMHRDLKPSNVLVNCDGELKICDFGMSRKFPDESNSVCTPVVCTLWYRAPELLRGLCSSYSGAIDMWSVGCIMAEFFLRRVLFAGDTEIQQFVLINDTILDQSRTQFYNKFSAAMSEKGGPVLTELGFDLLCQLLAYEPNDRISAEDALNHKWFDELDLDYHVFM